MCTGMGCLSQIILIVIYVAATQINHANFRNLEGLKIAPAQSVDDGTAKIIASTFSEGLVKCGAFKSKDAQNFKEPMLILSRSARSLPDVIEAHPVKIRELAETFASGVAGRMAPNLSPGDIDQKITCIIQALNKALVPTTGVVNFYFISEVKKMIKSFYFSKNASLSPIVEDSEDTTPKNRKAAIVKRSVPTDESIGDSTHGIPNAAASVGEAVNGTRPIPTEELIGNVIPRIVDAAESVGEAVNGTRPVPTEELIGDVNPRIVDTSASVGEAVNGTRPIPTEELIGDVIPRIVDAE